MPFFFGLWSIFLGQDRNFDLANYHLYNGFAFLNDKFNIDIAAAGPQSYLNPLLDVFFFYFNTHLNVYFFGFLMGFIHGINFILLFKIIENSLPKNLKRNPNLILLTSFAGCLSCNFLGGLGNSMGDNTTAIFILSSVLLAIKNWDFIINEKNVSSKKLALILLLCGFFIGTASALKLTNAPFVIALFIALLAFPVNIRNRLLLCFYFSIGVLAAITIFGGFWYLKMWEFFQNPFFPYLGNIFHNKFSSYSNPTISWLPQNFFEKLIWPFIITFDYKRVSEGHFHQIIWPFFYLLFLYILIFRKGDFFRQKNFLNLDDKTFFLFLFVFISYFIWMHVFSVIRYLVSIELLLPLLIILFLIKIFPLSRAKVIGKFFLISSILITLVGGYGTWGHASWKTPPFSVELPAIPQNINNKISVIISGGAPLTWMTTQFPKEIAFFRFGVFNSDNYIKARILERDKTSLFVMFGGYYNWRVDNVHRWNEVLNFFGLMKQKSTCDLVSKFVRRVNFRGDVTFKSPRECYLKIKDFDFLDPDIGNKLFIKENYDELKSKGIIINPLACSYHKANLGSQNWRYIWCKASII